ncbi:hypothetical protein PR202_ga03319 [Eleusine coracana subsp. coracana]|uniref:ABC transporter domain-containing protein n=1 Tax=Eleusine coracana subsp. coracana TaxID=191504 RepID=A0AAV5BPL3_ELECO|nr:hypothetical protein PR202_ga03319 [Eleusine coracana subsp. coracana]
MAWVAAHLLVLLAAAAAAARVLDVPRLSLAQTSTADYDDGTGGTGDKGARAIVGSPIVAGVMNERLKALTSSFAKAIGKQLDYCIKDTSTSIACSTAGENGEKNYVIRPNKNCNLSSWIDGCEPGWACSVGKDQKINLQDDKEIPYRALKCQQCCAGFFCPHGLTCMIPCPLGAYCPLSVLNKTTGICDPFYCRKGSTSQTRCYKKSSCPQNSATQDITIFGALLVASKISRGCCKTCKRETAQARERWKSAKDVAKKAGVGLQSQLSRTFSRKKAGTQAGPSRIGAGMSQDAGGKKNNLTDMVRNLDENSDNDEGFNVEVGDKALKKPTGKQMHTRSQIFKYAYGQIEKEKAMQQENHNMTFSGVISMAKEHDVSSRPVIEIAFKDLTLTLKGSKKKLLRSVTGKLSPGRVAAVMGPSGAGKTTFLSAIAGKATGCETSGLVLINGKIEPIRGYKKIIGFVPQDDIVHGNLTVEENLWFNARCRLSADMSKADKVLVVERVIESLGLQAVRDSLVGTVEQRGISGGQRKRVNVGLEMVMEPSVFDLR